MDKYIELKERILNKGWVESTATGNAAVGITLENMLGKARKNFEIPDYNGIEIKSKCSVRDNNITLFSSVPDSYLFETKRLLETYGYHDDEYQKFKIFNVVLNTKYMTYVKSKYYLKLSVDYRLQQLILNVYSINGEFIENNARWSFQLLKEKLERKLKEMAFVEAERKWCPYRKKVYFRYHTVTIYKLKSFTKFIELIDDGTISVTFNVSVYRDLRRLGKIYDHGTIFRISKFDIEKLFDKIDV